MPAKFYLGVDVGTGSARAAVFDERGGRVGMGTQPLQRWEVETNFHEQSSEDIWRACGQAIRLALREGAVSASAIRGLGFDATCSLVALDAQDQPVTISPTGNPQHNVIMWMDHRAIPQANRINITGHTALRSVGGRISPEMEVPKLLWIKEHLPETWARAARFFDLADFLSYRATGQDARSLCTTTCKWNYRSSQNQWDGTFFRAVALPELTDDHYARIGAHIRQQGECAGALTPAAADELGLFPGISVAMSMIDAHAGGLGLLGMRIPITEEGNAPEGRLALICGSSTCHMAVSREEHFATGVWGPYYSALIPGLWLAEGGQSATGTLIDHVVYQHARGPELRARERSEGVTAYEILNQRLKALSATVDFPARLTQHLHVYPDYHGNRSPHADPTLRGMMTGLTLASTLDALAVQYLATLQALAYGTHQIIERLNSSGYHIETLIACGGDTKNELFLREHADITGRAVVLPKEPEAVLLGSAMLGAVACGDHPQLESAMAAMSQPGKVITPTGGLTAEYHRAKQKIFQLMLEHQRSYTEIMCA